MTTQAEIAEWFDRGIAQGYSYMLVIVDTFDYDDYPIYVNTPKQCHDKLDNPGEMQRVMEVYDLAMDKTAQLNAHRAFNTPKL